MVGAVFARPVATHTPAFMTPRSRYTILTALVLTLSSCSREEAANPAPAAGDAVPAPAQAEAGQVRLRVLFLGDSITAGYGLDPDQAFPALLQRRADSLGLAVDMVNAGLSGETSAGGLRRIGWLLRQPVDILVLELGGNDGLRGVAVPDIRRNLEGIIDSLRARAPEARVVLAGMMIPPNLGSEYTAAFRDVYPAVARSRDAVLIPFLLEDVGGVAERMLDDGIHPNAEGHAVMAETVWETLAPMLPDSR